MDRRRHLLGDEGSGVGVTVGDDADHLERLEIHAGIVWAVRDGPQCEVDVLYVADRCDRNYIG